MSAWIECVHCGGRGRTLAKYEETRGFTSLTYIERVTGYKTCPYCNGEGKVLI